jgi:hypothetical protein
MALKPSSVWFTTWSMKNCDELEHMSYLEGWSLLIWINVCRPDSAYGPHFATQGCITVLKNSFVLTCPNVWLQTIFKIFCQKGKKIV